MIHGVVCCSPTSAATPEDTCASKINDEFNWIMTITSEVAARDWDQFHIKISKLGSTLNFYASVTSLFELWRETSASIIISNTVTYSRLCHNISSRVTGDGQHILPGHEVKACTQSQVYLQYCKIPPPHPKSFQWSSIFNLSLWIIFILTRLGEKIDSTCTLPSWTSQHLSFSLQ